ncbi:ribosome maturation factor RimP [Parvibaculum sp.]|jgi:ribosome maturation factor RimP|uniref:ribosome maturation factor RimP n=1 Tax=Parvibaculum sp. TaxID=2024848 RepID=UPI000C448BAB|nr:ribosome maturation factor RimP [Parvibaculum sp.]HAC59136.1 ribosome maturation factor RimP [Rhodobiaceae bacterium]MAU61403.1 ribosome maturation factor RimP [Parvibaculum sp.]MBO6668323.1 ribosome maturation factor RimP [Parvibaculum sp.]MBO6693225.1 ribosome maturation factor RimP [Parvibaculum sp.]MBO6714559.1 ribosome maturation factor RimP [Parvibaculum sp.]|tara:strand:- start:2908 stop:3525 length:618 start_codon:yes stop_codon:yes gene_type:complete
MGAGRKPDDDDEDLAILDTHLVAPHGVPRKVFELLRPSAEGIGFEIVRIRFGLQDGHTLQIMAERADGSMSVEDCEELSRTLSAVLDVEDPIPGEYNLEISSPGIDRPLTRPKDFERWKGFDVKIELAEPIEGRKRFRGTLQGVEGGEVLVECDIEGYSEPQVLGLPFEKLSEAKLVMSDDLIRESLKRQGRAEDASEDAPSDGE